MKYGKETSRTEAAVPAVSAHTYLEPYWKNKMEFYLQQENQ
jgi:hypothetical protein